jgi:hypothetical protein
MPNILPPLPPTIQSQSTSIPVFENSLESVLFEHLQNPVSSINVDDSKIVEIVEGIKINPGDDTSDLLKNKKLLLEIYIDSFLSDCQPMFNKDGFLIGFTVNMNLHTNKQKDKFEFSVDQFIVLGFELIERYDLLIDVEYKKKCKLLSKKIKFIYKYYINSERTRGKARSNIIKTNSDMRKSIDDLNKITKQKIDIEKAKTLAEITNIKTKIVDICDNVNYEQKINSAIGGRQIKKSIKKSKRKMNNSKRKMNNSKRK